MTTVNIRIEELAQQLDLEILERGKGIIASVHRRSAGRACNSPGFTITLTPIGCS